MKITGNSVCRNCDKFIVSHTKGVFGYGKEEYTLHDLYKLLPSGYWNDSKCKNFVPKDNLLYLEFIYEIKSRVKHD